MTSTIVTIMGQLKVVVWLTYVELILPKRGILIGV